VAVKFTLLILQHADGVATDCPMRAV